MHLHFVYLLVFLLAGAAVHIAQLRDRRLQRGAEIALQYLLVGYCGVPMLAVSLWLLMRPDQAARAFGLSAAGPLVEFFGYAYLGMSVLALLVLWYRGTFLVAPVIVWAIYLGGATVVHLEASERGWFEIFASHGLVAVLLVGALVLSGAWRRRVITSS